MKIMKLELQSKAIFCYKQYYLEEGHCSLYAKELNFDFESSIVGSKFILKNFLKGINNVSTD